MTDKETANAMPVVAHMYGVIVSKNLKYNEKNQKANMTSKEFTSSIYSPSNINSLSFSGENIICCYWKQDWYG